MHSLVTGLKISTQSSELSETARAQAAEIIPSTLV